MCIGILYYAEGLIKHATLTHDLLFSIAFDANRL